MGISDGALAARLIDELAGSGARIAVLHREAEAAQGKVTSDIDLIADARGIELVARSYASIRRLGLNLVSVWEYDWRSTTLVFATDTADAGVQVDVVCDPRGNGKYRLRTERLLDRSVLGVRWPTLHPEDAAEYLLIKGSVKGQASRVIAARARLHALGSVAGSSQFTPDGLPWRLRRQALTLIRFLRRVFNQPGYWVRVEDEAVAADAAAVFARFMPHAVAGTISLKRLPRMLRLRWTSGVCFLHGRTIVPVDLSLGRVDATDATNQAVSSMAARYRASISAIGGAP